MVRTYLQIIDNFDTLGCIKHELSACRFFIEKIHPNFEVDYFTNLWFAII